MKINVKVDEAVKKYAEDIMENAKKMVPTINIECDYLEAQNTEMSEQANSAMITSELGIVIVFPDFNKKTASACILNLGELHRMQSEGFDEEFIETEGKIYGKSKAYNKNNVNTFAYYLSHKIDVLKAYRKMD